MSVSALNGISKHTKFVILITLLQIKQTWKKTEGYVTRFGKEKRKFLELKFFKSNNAVQLCDLRPICWLPAVPFGRSVGLSLLFYNVHLWEYLRSRDGVKDTRLEAKTQKNPSPRPRTALTRTDSLEAENRSARRQGHKRKCSPKKKGLPKKFSGDLQKKKRFPKNFSGAPQTYNNSKNSAVFELRTGQFSRT